jgi:DNA invertase Pin-like site-specific DNA recombinase
MKFFEDKISSRKIDRPGLATALEYLRSGDTLAVWKLDRLGRSVKEVLTLADELYERGIGLRILTGTLAGSYTPTGEGKFFFTIMAAFAELEGDMIQPKDDGRPRGRPHPRPHRRPPHRHGPRQTRRCDRTSRPRRECHPDRQSPRGVPRDDLPARRSRHHTRSELTDGPPVAAGVVSAPDGPPTP